MDRRSLFLTVLLLIACSLPADARERDARRAQPPRVGTIKDYPGTGLMTGCGNVYVTRESDVAKSPPRYVFLSGPEGDHAWMNLDGRDTRLRHIRSWTSHEPDPMQRTFYSEYRHGATQIHIESKPRPDSDDGLSSVKIILRRGESQNVVEAVGSSDC